MIFLPKKSERTLAALRLYVQKSILKRGVCEKNITQLKKIYLTEAIVLKEERDTVDAVRLADVLLGASLLLLYQRGVRVTLSFTGQGVYRLNKRLYSVVLLLLIGEMTDGGVIRLCAGQAHIALRVDRLAAADRLLPPLRALNGFLLKERTSGRAVVVIPAERSDQTPDPIENEWVYLADRFSVVNVFLGGAQNAEA